jgi:hypothetical protein
MFCFESSGASSCIGTAEENCEFGASFLKGKGITSNFQRLRLQEWLWAWKLVAFGLLF